MDETMMPKASDAKVQKITTTGEIYAARRLQWMEIKFSSIFILSLIGMSEDGNGMQFSEVFCAASSQER